MRALLYFGLVLLFLKTFNSRATSDPSNTLLLQQSNKSNKNSGLDSSRYVIKNSKQKPTNVMQEKPLVVQEKSLIQQGNQLNKGHSLNVNNKVDNNEPSVSSVTSLKSSEDEIKEKSINPTNDSYKKNPDETSVNKEPQIIKEVSDYFLGNEKTLEYTNQLPIGDPRRKLVEATFAPTFIYNDSRSNYWYRNYTTSTPALLFDVCFWLSPFFGVKTQYMGSMSGDVRSSHNQNVYSQMTHQWFDAGIRFRQFSNMNKLDHFQFGIDFDEYQFRVPPDDLGRVRLNSAGVKFLIEGFNSIDKTHAWLWGFSISPFQYFREVSTGIDLSSGSRANTTGFTFFLGRGYYFTSKNQLYWKLIHQFEKQFYSGSASQLDPLTGVAPTGVSVMNSFILLQFGLIWGVESERNFLKNK